MVHEVLATGAAAVPTAAGGGAGSLVALTPWASTAFGSPAPATSTKDVDEEEEEARRQEEDEQAAMMTYSVSGARWEEASEEEEFHKQEEWEQVYPAVHGTAERPSQAQEAKIQQHKAQQFPEAPRSVRSLVPPWPMVTSAAVQPMAHPWREPLLREIRPDPTLPLLQSDRAGLPMDYYLQEDHATVTLSPRTACAYWFSMGRSPTMPRPPPPAPSPISLADVPDFLPAGPARCLGPILVFLMWVGGWGALDLAVQWAGGDGTAAEMLIYIAVGMSGLLGLRYMAFHYKIWERLQAPAPQLELEV